MRKVTLSPTHGPVGDHLQIYADRFFGHYGEGAPICSHIGGFSYALKRRADSHSLRC